MKTATASGRRRRARRRRSRCGCPGSVPVLPATVSPSSGKPEASRCGQTWRRISRRTAAQLSGAAARSSQIAASSVVISRAVLRSCARGRATAARSSRRGSASSGACTLVAASRRRCPRAARGHVAAAVRDRVCGEPEVVEQRGDGRVADGVEQHVGRRVVADRDREVGEVAQRHRHRVVHRRDPRRAGGARARPRPGCATSSAAGGVLAVQRDDERHLEHRGEHHRRVGVQRDLAARREVERVERARSRPAARKAARCAARAVGAALMPAGCPRGGSGGSPRGAVRRGARQPPLSTSTSRRASATSATIARSSPCRHDRGAATASGAPASGRHTVPRAGCAGASSERDRGRGEHEAGRERDVAGGEHVGAARSRARGRWRGSRRARRARRRAGTARARAPEPSRARSSSGAAASGSSRGEQRAERALDRRAGLRAARRRAAGGRTPRSMRRSVSARGCSVAAPARPG